MIKRYFLNNNKRNFSTASIWIKGGSDMDSVGKKGINKILSSLITRGCEGFNNFTLSEYIESYGAELNQEVFEDGISISIKTLNEHFSKLFPLLDLIINKPILSETEFKKVKKSSINRIKKDKENPFIICFEKWKKIVYSNHPYAFNTIGNANDVSKITYEDVLLEFKNFKIRENYLLLKKWWETIDLTNYEKSFLNREIISFNQQLLRLKEKKIRIGAYGKSGVGKSSVLNSLLKKDIFKTDIINGTTKEIQSEICNLKDQHSIV